MLLNEFIESTGQGDSVVTDLNIQKKENVRFSNSSQESDYLTYLMVAR